jgi:hypothetical protein
MAQSSLLKKLIVRASDCFTTAVVTKSAVQRQQPPHGLPWLGFLACQVLAGQFRGDAETASAWVYIDCGLLVKGILL